MFRIKYYGIAFLAFITTSVCQGSLVWIGSDGNGNGGDGVSAFQEANWVIVDPVTGALSTPPVGSINPGQGDASPITAVTNSTIIISSSDPNYLGGTPGSLGGNFEFNIGTNDLVVSGLRLGIGTTASGGLQSPGAPNNVLVEMGGDTEFQFLNSIALTLDTGSTLTLRGGADPIANGSTIDLLDTASVLEFSNETFAAFDAEHIDDVTFNGAALNFGSDPFLIEAGDNAVASAFNGASGVQISAVASVAAVPEPGSFGILLFAAVGCMTRRSRN